jgi:hypothetical protein
MSPPLVFSDPRLRAIQRRAYENFCDRPEVRDWLLSQISDGTYLHFGPFGYFDNHLLLPVRVGDLCVDLVYWHCDVEPDTACFRRVVGIANVLGAEAIRRALDFDSPLRIYRTPWRLLLASNEDEFVTINGAPGAVILNVGDPSYWARLARFAELHAEDRSHAVELGSNIRASGAKPPPILFPDSGESRAAA